MPVLFTVRARTTVLDNLYLIAEWNGVDLTEYFSGRIPHATGAVHEFISHDHSEFCVGGRKPEATVSIGIREAGRFGDAKN